MVKKRVQGQTEPGTRVEVPQDAEAAVGTEPLLGDGAPPEDGEPKFALTPERNRVLVTAQLPFGTSFRAKSRSTDGDAFLTGWCAGSDGAVLPCATGATLRVWVQTSRERVRTAWIEIGTVETPKQSHRGLSIPTKG